MFKEIYKNGKGTWNMKTGTRLDDLRDGAIGYTPEASIECPTDQRKSVKELIEQAEVSRKFRECY